jgi:hypothetical protein
VKTGDAKPWVYHPLEGDHEQDQDCQAAELHSEQVLCVFGTLSDAYGAWFGTKRYIER